MRYFDNACSPGTAGSWTTTLQYTCTVRYIHRARDFMQLHILQCRSPLCLKISLFYIFAKPVSFNEKKNPKLLFQWYNSTVFAYLGLFLINFENLHLSTWYHMVTLFKPLMVFFHLDWPSYSISYFLQKISLSGIFFCCLWSLFLHFQIAYKVSLALYIHHKCINLCFYLFSTPCPMQS